MIAIKYLKTENKYLFMYKIIHLIVKWLMILLISKIMHNYIYMSMIGTIMTLFLMEMIYYINNSLSN